MRGHRAAALVHAPVLVRGIRLGEVQSVLLASASPRIVGFDVLCGDGAHRFLPFSTARLGRASVELDSALTLLDPAELEFYRANGRSLASVPALADALVEPDGELVVPLTSRC